MAAWNAGVNTHQNPRLLTLWNRITQEISDDYEQKGELSFPILEKNVDSHLYMGKTNLGKSVVLPFFSHEKLCRGVFENYSTGVIEYANGWNSYKETRFLFAGEVDINIGWSFFDRRRNIAGDKSENRHYFMSIFDTDWNTRDWTVVSLQVATTPFSQYHTNSSNTFVDLPQNLPILNNLLYRK